MKIGRHEGIGKDAVKVVHGVHLPSISASSSASFWTLKTVGQPSVPEISQCVVEGIFWHAIEPPYRERKREQGRCHLRSELLNSRP